MTTTQKRALSAWLREVAQTASKHADALDPGRTWQHPVGNGLDGVYKAADRAHLALTGKTILVASQEVQS